MRGSNDPGTVQEAEELGAVHPPLLPAVLQGCRMLSKAAVATSTMPGPAWGALLLQR